MRSSAVCLSLMCCVVLVACGGRTRGGSDTDAATLDVEDAEDSGSPLDVTPDASEVVYPLECLAPDGTYAVEDLDGATVDLVIAEGRLASIGGNPCYKQSTSIPPQVRDPIVDYGCGSGQDEWCRVTYICDTAGMCFHHVSIIRDENYGNEADPQWVVTGAANTGCIKAPPHPLRSGAWTIGLAACVPLCEGAGSCDGCGGDCPTTVEPRGLGWFCDTNTDCEVGLVCADPFERGSSECSQPCTTHAQCQGLVDNDGVSYQACHNCTSYDHPASGVCARTLICGASGSSDSCDDCLDTCRELQLPGCCTGVGCMCESACG